MPFKRNPNPKVAAGVNLHPLRKKFVTDVLTGKKVLAEWDVQGVETKQVTKAIRPDSDPAWGGAPPTKRSVFPPGSDLMAFLLASRPARTLCGTSMVVS